MKCFKISQISCLFNSKNISGKRSMRKKKGLIERLIIISFIHNCKTEQIEKEGNLFFIQKMIIFKKTLCCAYRIYPGKEYKIFVVPYFFSTDSLTNAKMDIYTRTHWITKPTYMYIIFIQKLTVTNLWLIYGFSSKVTLKAIILRVYIHVDVKFIFLRYALIIPYVNTSFTLGVSVYFLYNMHG